MKTKSVALSGTAEPASLGVWPSAFTFRPPALLPFMVPIYLAVNKIVNRRERKIRSDRGQVKGPTRDQRGRTNSQ